MRNRRCPLLQAIREGLGDARAQLRGLPGEAVVVLLSVPVILTILYYFGRPDFYHANLRQYVPPHWPLQRMYGFFYFAIMCTVTRMFVPWVLMALMRRGPSQYGYAPPSRFEFAWVYGILFLLVIPFLWYASSLSSFQHRYPFGREIIVGDAVPLWDFVVYQAFYLFVFVSGESFWRGYILFGLYRHIGYLAIPVMVIPYVMVHFGKPWPETFGAILTGCVLGFLAIRHRSFWLGVAVHYAAAISMDLLAIHQRGLVFTW